MNVRLYMCVWDVIIIVILYAIDKYNTHAHVRKAGLFNLWEKISLNGTNRGHSEGLGVVDPGLLQKLGPNMSIKQVPSPLGQNQIIIPTNDSK